MIADMGVYLMGTNTFSICSSHKTSHMASDDLEYCMVLSWFLYFYNEPKLHRKEACFHWKKRLNWITHTEGLFKLILRLFKLDLRLWSPAILFSKFASVVYVNYFFIKNTAMNITLVYCIDEMQLCFINITVSHNTPTACLLTLWNRHYWI